MRKPQKLSAKELKKLQDRLLLLLVLCGWVLLSTIVTTLALYYRFHEISRLLLIAAILEFNICLFLYFLRSAIKKRQVPIGVPAEQTPSTTAPFTRNPPLAAALEAKKLESSSKIAWNIAVPILAIVVFIVVRYPVINPPYNYIGASVGAVAFILFLLASRWQKQSELLTRPLPLDSWICTFPVKEHSVEVAFQMPKEFNTPSTQDRLRVAARAILLKVDEVKEETLREALERKLSPEVDELHIPVFRIQILALTEPAPSSKHDAGIFIGSDE